MSVFTKYRRRQIVELRPYIEGENMERISVSVADKEAGSPKAGDMIARNPQNHDERWLIAAKYFADNFEPLGAEPPAARATAPKLPRHRRCPRCNQRLRLIDGEIEPHMEMPSAYGGTPQQCLPKKKTPAQIKTEVDQLLRETRPTKKSKSR